MRNHNSHCIGFYTELLERIYLDMVSAILPQDEIARDIDEIRTRARCEGMHFFTKVLPALGKSIDVSLASGTPLASNGFKRASAKMLPRFMLGCFERVFRSDGVPWFATWYADCLQFTINREKAVGCEENPHTSQVNPDPLDHVGSRVLKELVFWRGEDGQLQYGFPGMEVLSEVGFSRHEIDHISLGDREIPDPGCGNASLSSRRDAIAVALRSLRQVCFAFYKLELPYTDEQQAKVLADFVETDKSLPALENLDPKTSWITTQARRLICRVLANADPLSGTPRHGPGAVATGEKLPEKHNFARFYSRLDRVFKYDEWFFCNLSHVGDSLQELLAMEELESGTAKVVLVPKDSRGPRLISAEPLEYQWVQQALMGVLVDTIEKHELSRGQVNFTSQEINRGLALESSLDYSRVTLDMKEASDRVSLELVRALFPTTWFDALYASRTSQTRLPSGTIVPLKKFAPMGSAVCFPVEALIFWALSVAAVMQAQPDLSLRKATTKVFVYGDDIIADVDCHDVIINTLPMFGLQLNASKCCTAGPFKESCGMDAFFGRPVTPTKISSVWCESPEPSMIASYVEYSNAFYRSGHFETALFLERCVQWVLSTHGMYPVPTVSGGEPSCIAFIRGNELPIPKNRALGCKIRVARKGPLDFHRHEVQGYRITSKLIRAETEGWPFLLRKLTELETKNRFRQLDDPGACSLPTSWYPIAHRVKLKRAWTPLV